jgi:hypothetical protein
MKLSQALKQKNRLAGELVAQQRILARENSRRDDKPARVDCALVWGKIVQLSDDLGRIKAAIAAANVPIYPKIERMAELKSRINFVKGLEKREGPEHESIGGDRAVIVNWTAYVTEADADQRISAIQIEIDRLQDEVDAFNATTEIKL